ncbi:MAG: aminopeptidase P family protein [Candidatus Azobacteroides sp.]|nr:aminopeptidase P family protein [Candidatus Azobacteroides sp.]
METSIPQRLSDLRRMMKQAGVDACIVPASDPHLSEYIASHWKNREWISGFTGSAGTVVVTESKAGLWTDSRYFLQAGGELFGSGIKLFKAGLPKTPSINEWLISELKPGSRIGFDDNLFALAETEKMIETFGKKKIRVDGTFNPFPEIWNDRPGLPDNRLIVYPEKYAGKSVDEKISEIKHGLTKVDANCILLTALDEIAWAFNIRGSDVRANPVVFAFGFISDNEIRLFVSSGKLTDESRSYLSSQQIQVSGYDDIKNYLSRLDENSRILIDKNKVNAALFNCISKQCGVIFEPSPVALLKSVKNPVEIDGFRNAMIKDGVALVRFFRRLENDLGKEPITEMDIADRLIDARKQQELYVGESFATIAGFGEHGAIVHYSANEETNLEIKPDGFLLIDSGAQYFDGTTDITRTVALSELSPQQKKDFTLVMKGHIAIATCRFPQGTRGSQIDVLARKALWDNGLNYTHGTGHGVGHFLNVHEGPQNIRMEENPTQLCPGMVISNEPGIYRTGEYGIRCENLILVIEKEETDFGRFYAFETLTLFPFDQKAIDKACLTSDEITWINQYHQMVYTRLSPYLSEEEKNWLKEKTSAI